jgi:hypothetical protein
MTLMERWWNAAALCLSNSTKERHAGHGQDTVPSESIHTPLPFPHFIMLKWGIKVDLIVIFVHDLD